MRSSLATLVLAVAFLEPAIPAVASERARFDCAIDPSTVSRIDSVTPGILSEVRVGRGDRVVKGDTLVIIDDTIERASLALLTARADNKAGIALQEARLKLAQARLSRTRTLAERKVATRQQIEEAEADVEVVRQQVAEAKLSARVAQLEVERARVVLDQYIVKSPIDGIIVKASMEVGEYVRTETEILTVAQLNPLFVEVFVPVEHYRKIKVGDIAAVFPQEPIGGAFNAEVKVVDQIFDISSGTFGVRLELPNPDLSLPAGHRCEIMFKGVNDR